MFHLDNNSGVSAMPTPAATQNKTVRWFTEGSGNQSPSWPGQDWFNIVQAELLSILTAANITPDKSKINQLALAIKSIVGTDALLKKNNLSDLQDVATAKKNLSLDKVGNYAAVQANGGLHNTGTHRIYIDWGADEKLHATVDETDEGEFFTTKNPPTASQTDALPTKGGELTGIVKTSAEIQSTTPDNFRIVCGDYGIYWRQDGGNLYLMLTNAGDQYGRYNGFRPIRVDLASGLTYINEARPYSSGNKPTPEDISAIRGDACNQAGFVSQNADAPYMMYGGSNIVELARLPWVNDEIAAARNWANNDLRNDIYNWCRQSFITQLRRGEQVWLEAIQGGAGREAPAGHVVTGGRNNGTSNLAGLGFCCRPLQVCINGNWFTIGDI